MAVTSNTVSSSVTLLYGNDTAVQIQVRWSEDIPSYPKDDSWASLGLPIDAK